MFYFFASRLEVIRRCCDDTVAVQYLFFFPNLYLARPLSAYQEDRRRLVRQLAYFFAGFVFRTAETQKRNRANKIRLHVAKYGKNFT